MKRILILALLAGCASTTTSTEACIVTIANRNGDRIALYEKVQIVGSNSADEWMVRRDGYDQPVNVPKVKVLRRGERRPIGFVVCQCPEAR